MLGQQIVFLKVMVGDVGMITPPSSLPPKIYPKKASQKRNKETQIKS